MIVTLTHLQILAKRYPDVPAVLAELANLEAVLTLPKSAMSGATRPVHPV